MEKELENDVEAGVLCGFMGVAGIVMVLYACRIG